MADAIEIQVLLDAMQAELAAQREILAFLAYEVAATAGLDISDISERLKVMAEAGQHQSVNERVAFFANWIVGPDRPQFTIIDGGKV